MNNIQFNNKIFSPTKCICVGRNYTAHIAEMGSEKTEDIVFFCKPNAAISSRLISVHDSDELHFETELCFLMENSRPIAMTLGFDLTKREIQRELKKKGLPWERSKAFNGAAVIGPFVDVPAQLDTLEFTLHVDGSLRQHGQYGAMLFKPDEIFADLNKFMKIEDGDIVMTGTPAGVGGVIAGAKYQVRLFDSGRTYLSHEWIAQ